MSGGIDLDLCYSVVLELVKTAEELIRNGINSAKEVQHKSCEVDLVTETDQQVEKLLISGLRAKFPDHKFIGEESTADGQKNELTDAPTWIIDPVDGTMNFVHSFPHVCISIALLVNKVPEIGIITNPVLGQFFEARKGQGALLNGKKIQVSAVKDLSKALLSYEVGTSRDPEKMKVVLKNVNTLVPLAHGIRCLGSAALNMAMVAMGASDSYIEFGIHAWDIAAGDLIVREAGGVVIDPAGGEFDVMSRRCLCASSIELAKEIVTHIEQYYPGRD
ncbi:inositol monophosphatase 1 [Neocloeon triangulifer]|uniref:inositol monophosphatase 1 n=1 Tax=Neocloeon triangulifer TaxID=2078957 RepID=UPI00286F84B4|nr:inositol monophosphatase 1 [Neocloeon triangulifer]